MFCKAGKSCCFSLLIVTAVIVFWALNPVKWLADKPANTDASYVSGWKDGCESGANANSLTAPFMNKPFVRQLLTGEAKEQYLNAWNEAYTSCRFYQGVLYGWIETLLIIAAILGIGARYRVKSE